MRKPILHMYIAMLMFLPGSVFSIEQDNSKLNSEKISVTNGCGSGWSTWLVPDSIPILKCELAEACNGHDVCYGVCEGQQTDKTTPECEYLRCRKGGDLSKTDCAMPKFRSLLGAADDRKLKCDNKLHQNIRDINKGKPACEAFALVYRFSVKKWGEDYFRGIDPTGKILNQPKREYDKAIRDFFQYGTKEQFSRLIESIDADRPIVDFGEPIKYDKNMGLVNKKQP